MDKVTGKFITAAIGSLISTLGLLTSIVLLLVKVSDKADISWLTVGLPFIIGFGLGSIIMVGAMVAAFFAASKEM